MTPASCLQSVSLWTAYASVSPRLKQAPFTVQAYLEGQTIDYMADTSEVLVLIS